MAVHTWCSRDNLNLQPLSASSSCLYTFHRNFLSLSLSQRVYLMLNKPNECGGSLCITKPDECGGVGMVEYIPPFTLLGEPASSTYTEHIRVGALFYYGKKLKT